MGDPRKFKNHYSSTKRPYDMTMLEEERALKKKYGIRRKREIRKMEYIWKNLRKRARLLIAEKDKEKTNLLFKKIDSYGLCQNEKSLESILALKLEDVMERRLQTIICKLNLANTPGQARQYVVHRHVSVDGVIIFSPNYIVKKEEENKIILTPKLDRGEEATTKKEVEETKDIKPKETVKEEVKKTEDVKPKETVKEEVKKTQDKSKENIKEETKDIKPKETVKEENINKKDE